MESLIYLGSIVVLVIIGFVFAVRLSVRAIHDSEHDWADKAAAAAASGHEPALAGERKGH